MSLQAYHKVQDPEFQESVKTNLKTGFEKTKQLVTGQAPQPTPAQPEKTPEPQKKREDKDEDEEEEML